MRADKKFEAELKDILRQRIALGRENLRRLNGTRRLTAAIRRHKAWNEIKKDIINAELGDVCD